MFDPGTTSKTFNANWKVKQRNRRNSNIAYSSLPDNDIFLKFFLFFNLLSQSMHNSLNMHKMNWPSARYIEQLIFKMSFSLTNIFEYCPGWWGCVVVVALRISRFDRSKNCTEVSGPDALDRNNCKQRFSTYKVRCSQGESYRWNERSIKNTHFPTCCVTLMSGPCQTTWQFTYTM